MIALVSEHFIIGVPSEDRAELAALVAEIGEPDDLVEHRYFDASLFVDALIHAGMSAAAWDVVRTWIKSRAEVKKATRISVGGIEMTALSPRDAKKMLKNLAAHLERADDDDT